MSIAKLALHHDTCAMMEGKSHCTCDVTKGTEKIVRRRMQ